MELLVSNIPASNAVAGGASAGGMAIDAGSTATDDSNDATCTRFVYRN